MDYVTSDSGKVYFDTYNIDGGDVTPWLLVFPGMAMRPGMFSDFARALLPHFKVVIINNRGIPPSDAWSSKIPTIREALNDTLAVCQKLKINHCHVLGESFGGMLAMSLAESFPALVQSLTVVNSSIAGSRKPRLNLAAVASIAKAVCVRSNLWPVIAQNIFSQEFTSKHPERIERWLATFGQTPFPHAAVRAQTIAAALYHGSKLSQVNCTTFVIYSELDRFVDTIHSQKIQAKIPGAVLQKLDRVGHHACGEAPEALAELVFNNFKSIH